MADTTGKTPRRGSIKRPIGRDEPATAPKSSSRLRVTDVDKRVDALKTQLNNTDRNVKRTRLKTSQQSKMIIGIKGGEKKFRKDLDSADAKITQAATDIEDLQRRTSAVEAQLKTANKQKSSDNPVLKDMGERNEAKAAEKLVDVETMSEALSLAFESFREELFGDTGVITLIQNDVETLKGHFGEGGIVPEQGNKITVLENHYEVGGRAWQTEEGVKSLHTRVSWLEKLDKVSLIAGAVVGVITFFIVLAFFPIPGDSHPVGNGIWALLWGTGIGFVTFFVLDLIRTITGKNDSVEYQEDRSEEKRVKRETRTKPVKANHDKETRPSSLSDLVEDPTNAKYAGLSSKELFELFFEEEFDKLNKLGDRFSAEKTKQNAELAIERASARSAAFNAAAADQPNETEPVTAGATKGSRV